ncbi:MAG: hypothetical protein ABFD50_07945 [Smithella sp.]
MKIVFSNCDINNNDIDFIDIDYDKVKDDPIEAMHKATLLFANELKVPVSNISIRFVEE